MIQRGILDIESFSIENPETHRFKIKGLFAIYQGPPKTQDLVNLFSNLSRNPSFPNSIISILLLHPRAYLQHLEFEKNLVQFHRTDRPNYLPKWRTLNHGWPLRCRLIFYHYKLQTTGSWKQSFEPDEEAKRELQVCFCHPTSGTFFWDNGGSSSARDLEAMNPVEEDPITCSIPLLNSSDPAIIS